jgi:hypothetical protein
LSLRTHSEEELAGALQDSTRDRKLLAVCLQSECGQLLYQLLTGSSSREEDSRIVLAEYQGNYWVLRGRHRVCVAKRFGIPVVKAEVKLLPDDGCAILPELGQAGEFRAEYRPRTGAGEWLWLRVCAHDGMMEGGMLQNIALGADSQAEGQATVLAGISVRQEVVALQRFSVFKFGRDSRVVRSSVRIDAGHPKTKVWLAKIWVRKGVPRSVVNLYRRGRWRRRDLGVLFGGWFGLAWMAVSARA